MSSYLLKRQRLVDTSDTDSSNEVSFMRNALNHFKNRYSGFLQECMTKSGLSATMASESNEAFVVMMSKSLELDLKAAQDIEVLCEYRENVSNIESPIQIEKFHDMVKDSAIESKISTALNLYKAEAYTFRKLCMLIAGYNPLKALEKDPCYISFLLSSINIVKEYLDDLKSTCKAVIETPTVEKDVTKINDTDLEFSSSASEKEFTSVTFEHKSTHYTIYRAKKDNSEVALKVLNEATDYSNNHSLDNELQSMRHISHPCLRKPLTKITYNNNPALTLDWFDGKPIEECGKFSIEDFMFVSREIVSAVDALHSENINHLNLTTTNVLVNTHKKRVKIIGFTSSTKCETISFDMGNKKRLERCSKFIPPEQTGCVNLHVDLRSDFYDLGMVFYFMLAGDFPFNSDNRSELVYNSLFRFIPPLNLLDSFIPVSLSNMIIKLLEKDPANRYQSAKGILYDLDLIKDEKKDNLFYNTTRLAEHDFSSKLFLPQKLYDRASEIKALHSAFEKAREGSLEVVFIKGLSGVGKSHLAYELLESITREKGIFVNGKFDASTIIEPCSGIISALNRFCNLVLLESSSMVSFYKNKILAAVGEEGKILTTMVPKLRHIIGEQEHVVEAIGVKAKNRFEYICVNFMRAICTENRPVVFLLDDLHRADTDSFLLLSAMLKDRCLKHILFIGTYHSDKVDNMHPLAKVMTVISKNKVSVSTIELENLSNEKVNSLVSDTVGRSQITTVPLAALVLEKTAGNPFFIKIFLKSLECKGLLYFCKEKLYWKWTIEELVTSEMTANVLNFITEKIRQYDTSMQNFLIHASFMGSIFSLKTLKLVSDEPVDIDRMIKDGFIIPTEVRNSFQFTHDYVRQSVYSMVPIENRNFTYFSIGNLIWKKSTEIDMRENLFIVANMLNSSLDQLELEEKKDVAKLNFRAAEKSITLTAFQIALNFLETGIQLLDEDSWLTDYEFTLKYYRAAAETSYCLMNYDKMSQFLTILAKNANCNLDLVPSYLLQIKAFNNEDKYNDAFKLCLRVLDDLDEKLPLEIGDEIISKEIDKTMFQATQKLADMNSLQIVEDETIDATFQILHELFITAWFCNQKLLPLIGERIVKLTYDHGLSKYSALGFAMAGRMFCAKNDFDKGLFFGQISLEVIDKFKAKDLLPKVVAFVYIDIFFFKISIHKLWKPTLNAMVTSFEVGDNESCSYNLTVFYFYSFQSGKSLQLLIEDFENICQKVPRKSITMMSIYQSVLNLIGYGEDSENAWLLKGKYFDYQRDLDFDNQPGHAMRGILQCIILAYLFHEYHKANEWLELCKPMEDYLANTYQHTLFIFYKGLIYVELAKKGSSEKSYVNTIENCVDLLRIWSQSCPQNFLNKLTLLEAELAAIKSDSKPESLVESYSRAILSSKENGFIHETALAYERAGISFLSSGYADPTNYLHEAYDAYRQWGANAKLIQIKKSYPTYFADVKCSTQMTTDLSTRFETLSSVSELSSNSNALDIYLNE